ncbi:hypothetical protein SARC_17028 [Sphaeroforma arctica JP610]|uniref:Diphthine--ammonia ligase n=1 Tax=Sphaeroforma arctica JP610 TaxID=667725 RepID=A0A0L0F2P3_9EUKA|nr:hypothetical protein SARC_17028 [Sphaeroforma arctica JP610]KNC70443.1 hypothetical protein SARC_17028 [Sphaeroforma arctica JP610]|eukprot:XP_014144345.1 hypothetical protein SARC_17028 [Sphaeroforma arctica JP610]
MELPLFRGDLIGRPVATEMHYTKPLDARDEVEDLYDLLSDVKRQMPLIEGVSVGAILSDYQRLRVELVCQKLGLKSLAYMWHRDQHDLLSDIIESGVTAVGNLPGLAVGLCTG